MNNYMIKSEKELEDYICNNIEELKKLINNMIFGNNGNIKFIGRQVQIGKLNIADLIFINEYAESIPVGENGELTTIYNHDYIIVELKFRELEPKDLSQLARYMNTLQSKLLNDGYEGSSDIYGIFISLGMNKEMEEISMLEQLKNNIFFVNVVSTLSFSINNLCYKEDYISDLKLDDRINAIYKEN